MGTHKPSISVEFDTAYLAVNHQLCWGHAYTDGKVWKGHFAPVGHQRQRMRGNHKFQHFIEDYVHQRQTLLRLMMVFTSINIGIARFLRMIIISNINIISISAINSYHRSKLDGTSIFGVEHPETNRRHRILPDAALWAQWAALDSWTRAPTGPRTQGLSDWEWAIFGLLMVMYKGY